MKILYVTDLDGTLITEQLTASSENIPVLETAHGKSYISKSNLELLKRISKRADVMPLTTRSRASFAKFDMGIDFKYALIENGGCLIENGKENTDWESCSKDLMKEGMESEALCRSYLEEHGYFVKSNSKFVIDYINKNTDAEETQKCYEELKALVGNKLDVVLHATGQIFAIHHMLRKNENLNRFLKTHAYDIVITSGDSEADYDMLKEHIGIGLTDSPAAFKFPSCEHRKDNHAFTEFVLKKVLSITEKY